MDLSWISDAAKVAGGAIGGGAVSAFFGWMTARSKAPSIAQDAVNRAVRTALESTTREIDRLNAEIENLRRDHKTEMAACRASHEKCEREQRKLREELDRLMRLTKPADYTTLKRVSPKR